MKNKLQTTLILLVIALLIAIFVCACNPFEVPQTPSKPTPNPEKPTPDDDTRTKSQVQIVSVPQGIARYEGVKVLLEEVPLPLYNVKVNQSQIWNGNTQTRIDSGVGYFGLEGKVNVTVRFDFPVTVDSVVRPLSAGVSVTASGNELRFVLSSSGNYVVEPCLEGATAPDGYKAVHLFVSKIEDDTPTGDNVVVFERGLHTKENDSRISSNNEITLRSNTTVYLQEGAVVRARFVADMAQNITICGKGIIDGSTFVRNANTGAVTVPLEFNRCKNVTLRDFSVLDPAGWCVNFYFNNDCLIDGIKIITSRSNGDGISLQSCQDIEVKNCFVRTWDDSLVVKNYPNWWDRNIEGTTKNITFTNCTLWTDLAQSMEIGYETVGKTLQNVTFKDITVLHNYHKPVVSIHNGNNADILDVTFDGITVERALMGRGDAGQSNYLVEIANLYSVTWSDQHKKTPLGSISGVTVKNLTVLSGNIVLPIVLNGCVDRRAEYQGSIHRVSNVTFENVWLRGKQMGQNYSELRTNSYVTDVSVLTGSAQYVAPFIFDKTAEELAQYTDHAVITIVDNNG